jgi:hypothetical protein
MQTRNIQTFLMVSAAFFAMSAPIRPSRGTTLAAAVAHSAQVVDAAIGTSQVAFQVVPGNAGDDTAN